MLRDRRKIIVIVLVIVLFVFISLPLKVTRTVRAPLTALVQPVCRVVTAVFERVVLSGKALVMSTDPYHELERLNMEQQQYQAQQVALQAEIERLQSVNTRLAEIDTVAYTFVPAIIVGREPGRWYNGAMLNKGSNAGIAEGQAVVFGSTYVGRVTEVGGYWSRISFVIDPSSAVPGQLLKTGHVGLVTGTSTTRLKLDYIDGQAQMKTGDTVVTAYFSDPEAKIQSILPPGFLIGTISAVNIEEKGWYSSAMIQPACDFNKLKTVFVVQSEEKP